LKQDKTRICQKLPKALEKNDVAIDLERV